MVIVATESIVDPHSFDQQKCASCSTTVMLYAKVESLGTTRTSQQVRRLRNRLSFVRISAPTKTHAHVTGNEIELYKPWIHPCTAEGYTVHARRCTSASHPGSRTFQLEPTLTMMQMHRRAAYRQAEYGSSPWHKERSIYSCSAPSSNSTLRCVSMDACATTMHARMPHSVHSTVHVVGTRCISRSSFSSSLLGLEAIQSVPLPVSAAPWRSVM